MLSSRKGEDDTLPDRNVIPYTIVQVCNTSDNLCRFVVSIRFEPSRKREVHKKLTKEVGGLL